MIIAKDMILAGAPGVHMRPLLDKAIKELDALDEETLVPDHLARVLAASWHDWADIELDNEVFTKPQLFDMVMHPERIGRRVLFYKETADTYRPQLVVYQ